MDSAEFRERVGYARANAINGDITPGLPPRAPYLAAAILRLIPVPVPGLKTMAVDKHWRWYIDPQVLTTWDIHAQGTAVIHEVNHLLRRHHERAEHLAVSAATQAAWAAASDSEINDDLVDARMPFPFEPVTPARLGYPNGETAETYYAHLTDRPKLPALRTTRPNAPATNQTGSDLPVAHDGCGSGADNIARPWDLPTGHDDDPDDDPVDAVDEAEAELLRRIVANDIVEHHKTRGDTPGRLVEWADALLRPPVVPWQHTLAVAVRRATAQKAGNLDYSYRRLARRENPVAVTPAMVQPKPRLAAVVDTSGSVRVTDVAIALNEVHAIAQRLGIRGRDLMVLQVDCELHDRRPLGPRLRVEIRGRGGTDMRVGIDATERLRPRPDLIVLLTDGYTPLPATPPRTPVVIAILDPCSADQTPERVEAWRSTLPDWATRLVVVACGSTSPPRVESATG